MDFIIALARLQAAATVSLLRGLWDLIQFIWTLLCRVFWAAIEGLADLLYPDPPEDKGQGRQRDRGHNKD